MIAMLSNLKHMNE
jgi:hypothetical protein